MSVITDEDVMVIDHLDFDYEEPCDFNRASDNPCGKAPDWKCVLPCCGKIYLFCDEHFWYTVKVMADTNLIVVCPDGRGGCGSEVDHFAHAEKITKGIGNA